MKKLLLFIIFLPFAIYLGYAEIPGNRIKEQFVYNEKDELNIHIIYNYDSNGILIETIGKIGDYIKYKEVKFYNSENFLMASIYYYVGYDDLDDLVYVPITIDLYEYDSNNNLRRKCSYSLENRKVYEYFLYIYDKDYINTIYIYSGDDTILRIIHFEYDNNGRRIKTLNENNETISWREYDETNLLKRVVSNDGFIRIFIWEDGETVSLRDQYNIY
jgi:hypothetical protein